MTPAQACRAALAVALEYGFAVVPFKLVQVGGELKKRPCSPHGCKDATSDPAAIRWLWEQHPGTLVAVATGAAGGVDVLDIDRRPAATRWWSERRRALPRTRTHRTRSGGLHLLFEHHQVVGCGRGRLPVGVDVRGEGGCIIWWPASGLEVLDESSVAAWPTWMLAEIRPPRPPAAPTRPFAGQAGDCLAGLVSGLQAAQAGNRNGYLHWAACRAREHVHAGRVGQDAAISALTGAAIATGLDQHEIGRTLASAFRSAS